MEATTTQIQWNRIHQPKVMISLCVALALVLNLFVGLYSLLPAAKAEASANSIMLQKRQQLQDMQRQTGIHQASKEDFEAAFEQFPNQYEPAFVFVTYQEHARQTGTLLLSLRQIKQQPTGAAASDSFLESLEGDGSRAANAPEPSNTLIVKEGLNLDVVGSMSALLAFYEAVTAGKQIKEVIDWHLTPILAGEAEQYADKLHGDATLFRMNMTINAYVASQSMKERLR